MRVLVNRFLKVITGGGEALKAGLRCCISYST